MILGRREAICWIVGIALSFGTVTTLRLMSEPTPATASDNSGEYSGGAPMPRSLAGVNPVHHRDIFGNPEAAAEYGYAHTAAGWTASPAVASAPPVARITQAYASVAPKPKSRSAVAHKTAPVVAHRTPVAPPAIDYRIVQN